MARSTAQALQISVIALTVLAVVGCSKADESPASDDGDSAWIDHYIHQAQAGDGPNGIPASTQQLEILERGRTQGELTMSDAVEAIENTAACLEAQGLTLTMRPPHVSYGFEQPAYTWGGPPSLSAIELAAIGDPCIEAESYYVELAYATQPRAVAGWEANFDDNLRDTMTACLDRTDVAYDPDASADELYELAGGAVFDLMDQGHSLEELNAGGLNCIHEVVMLEQSLLVDP